MDEECPQERCVDLMWEMASDWNVLAVMATLIVLLALGLSRCFVLLSKLTRLLHTKRNVVTVNRRHVKQ